MREILFKAKRVDNGEWVEGLLWKKKYNDGNRIFISCFPDKDDNEEVYVVCPETVSQFTGLRDKHGKMIFEGDIGRYKQTDGANRNGKPIICTGKVVYWAKTASFAVESKDEKGVEYFDYFPIKDFEIIGNIHDNPELLESEDTE